MLNIFKNKFTSQTNICFIQFYKTKVTVAMVYFKGDKERNKVIKELILKRITE